MVPAMSPEVSASAVLLVGVMLIRLVLADVYQRYVRVSMGPWLLLAGVLLTALGLAMAARAVRRSVPAAVVDGGPGPDGHPGHDHDGDLHDGHDLDGDLHDGHGPGGDRIGWLLLAPVLVLLLVAPPALGSYAAGRTGSAVVAKSDYAPLPAGDPLTITMLDYASRAVFDRGASLGERRVQLTGFAMRGPDHSWLLARMMVSCCAADARPVKIALDGELPDGLAEEQWLRVTGKYSGRQLKDTVNGETIPFIEVSELTLIQVPDEQYES